MSAAPLRRARPWPAIVAVLALCYALALQAMTGPAMAFAAHMPGDAGAHAECLGTGGSQDGSGGNAAHDGSCCDLGCLSRSTALPPPPSVAAIPVVLPAPLPAAGASWPPGVDTGPPPPSGAPPQAPRAPPAA